MSLKKFRVAGLPEPPSGRGVNLRLPCVSPHYTSALGLSLVSGRWFADTDGDLLPEMKVGRLPALVPFDLTNYLIKVRAFEETAADYRSRDSARA